MKEPRVDYSLAYNRVPGPEVSYLLLLEVVKLLIILEVVVALVVVNPYYCYESRSPLRK